MADYEKHLRHIYENGFDIVNERTGKICRTVPLIDQQYNVGAGVFPIVTTRKVGIKVAIAELLGYLRGYNNAADFRALGTNSWDANANETPAWLANPNRKGVDDMGRVYGAVARKWPKYDGGSIDVLRKIYNNLRNGIDDRGEVLTFWNPGEFELGCLRPCMYEHIFTLINGTLHMASTQRSNDFPIGNCANRIQCYVLLALMAQITGNKAGIANHRSTNAHIYGDQLADVEIQLSREPLDNPNLKLWINPEIRTLEDLETWVTLDDFKLEGYDNYHPAIQYAFAV